MKPLCFLREKKKKSIGVKPHHMALFQGYRMDPRSLYLPVRLWLRTHSCVDIVRRIEGRQRRRH